MRKSLIAKNCNIDILNVTVVRKVEKGSLNLDIENEKGGREKH